MTEAIAGVEIPDSVLARDITRFIRDTENDVLYHHSRRVFLFGMLQGQVRGRTPDPELLYAGAMFHDIGLTDGYLDSHERFEVDGARAAADFLRGHGLSNDEARQVWLAIALHTTPNIPHLLEPVIALVTAGVETDVLGIGFDDLTAAQRAEVTQAHPRPNFKQNILHEFTQGNVHRPETTFGNVNADVLDHYMEGYERDDFVEIILNNPWPE